MQTTIKLLNKCITVKGLKRELELAENTFRQLQDIRHYIREITGLKEDEASQRKTLLYACFGTHKIDEENYQKELTEFVNTLADSYTYEEVRKLFPKISELFNKYVAVNDKTETKQEREEKANKANQAEEKHRQQQEEKEAFLGIGAQEIIERTEDDMFITLECCFDDSDAMRDYFNRHASLSQTYVLAVVPKGRLTEVKARQALNAIPELSKYQWTWNTENYSMGHSNYLESEFIGTCKHKAYDGREEVSYRYEIEFNTYHKKLFKSKYFLSSLPAQNNTPPVNGSPVNGHLEIVDYSEKAIAVFGDTKPIKDTLKQLGGRFNAYLTHKGQKKAGWIFSKKQEQAVRAALQPMAAANNSYCRSMRGLYGSQP